jgi:hypothetical protein
MDLSDAERYAVAALFTLALHSTHVSGFPHIAPATTTQPTLTQQLLGHVEVDLVTCMHPGCGLLVFSCCSPEEACVL